jgi:hypothetical protein
MSAIDVTPLAKAAPNADTATGSAFLHDPGEAEQVSRLTASRIGSGHIVMREWDVVK